ncbi:MAG: hypothetical protein K6C69_03430 [Lachnospiraceae bacterium]|nr:hypothetical protein [Lachnospiraceae bacterium]
MTEAIAIYYENIIIYWRTIIIVLGVIAGFFISLSLYKGKKNQGYTICIYYPLAILASLFMARLVHWYCNIEQYGGIGDALSDFSKGDFLLPGVLIAAYLVALLVAPFSTGKSRYGILDAVVPGLCFILAMIKFSDVFTDVCRGKMIVNNVLFQKLPFAIAVQDHTGTVVYRFATFFVTFLLLCVVTVGLIVFYVMDAKTKRRFPMEEEGHTFRMFLLFYGAVEIVMDSTRYDAAHLYFPGEALANLNKGASFMGLSQMMGAIFVIYVVVYYMKLLAYVNHSFKSCILPLILSLMGLILGGVSEYLVQRYSGMYLIWYSTQSLGVLLMVGCAWYLYRQCLRVY